MSEELETETRRVVPWLMDRADQLKETLKRKPPSEDIGDLPQLTTDSVVAFVLAPDGKLSESLRLTDLIKSDGDKKREDRLKATLKAATLVVDVRVAGLEDGLLNHSESLLPVTADTDGEWQRLTGMRVRKGATLVAKENEPNWRFEDDFAITKTEEGEVTEWLIVERLKNANVSEDGRAIAKPQSLENHKLAAAAKARDLAAASGLKAGLAQLLEIAARLHDEGKAALRWQRAFNAARDTVYAKTKGPINQALLDGYRHEFGSLPYVEKDSEFQKLPGDLRDLVLHLVAAHHGGARPVIETRGCDDAPPSGLEGRARDVALRFARLQRRWGPWGLAWWEALLRAADQQASRDNDARAAEGGKASGEEEA